MNRPLENPVMPPGTPNLVLIGPMGSGKTTLGRLVAEKLGMPFFDLDDCAIAASGMSIPEIFASRGEAAFRTLEAQLLAHATQLSGAVIATGGGAVLSFPELRQLTGRSVSFCLSCSTDELNRRLAGTLDHPLLSGKPESTLIEIIAAREAAYRAAGPQFDTSDRTPEELSSDLAQAYLARSKGMVTLTISGPEGPYPILVGQGNLKELGMIASKQLPDCGRALVIADQGAEPWALQAREALESAGLETSLTLPARGEAAKQLSAVEELWRALLHRELDRSDLVVAVGGGALLDAAGFAAATYFRGMPLINVPTTVLAMADASIGGKVAADFGGSKNSIGTFHHPRAVLVDVSTLATLPPRQLRAGLAEIVKCAMISSPLTLRLLGSVSQDQLTAPGPTLRWLVEEALRTKAAYVEADPRDLGLRHALNLGHTFAHGLEVASNYEMPHGEAVATGLLAATRLGMALGITPTEALRPLTDALTNCQLPLSAEGLDPAAIAAAMGRDKKRRSGHAVLVIPTWPGVTLVDGIDLDWAVGFLRDSGPAVPMEQGPVPPSIVGTRSKPQ